MKLNAGKTKTMIVSRSYIVHPQLTPFTLGGTVLKESADLVILGVMFDAKMTFEKHLCHISSTAAKRLGIMRKSSQVFHDRANILRSLWNFVLPVLEYCSAVWCSAADLHLKLLGAILEWNLAHHRSVAVLCMLFKIRSNPMHCSLEYVPARVTRGALVAHTHLFVSPQSRTSQYRRTFVPLSVLLWNDLGCPVYDGVGPVWNAEPMLSC